MQRLTRCVRLRPVHGKAYATAVIGVCTAHLSSPTRLLHSNPTFSSPPPSASLAPPPSHGPTKSDIPTSDFHVHSTLLQLLSHQCKGLPARGSHIHPLSTPTEFYQTLLDLSRTATQRILLSSLYLGTGPLESALVDAIAQRAQQQPSLRVDVLLDYYRGTRPVGNASSVTALTPLLALNPPSPSPSSPASSPTSSPTSSPPRVSVTLFQPPPPPSHPFLDRLFRGRWRELRGVHHMKFYVFDDATLISGANLSDTYFTNRQDRYLLIRHNREVADWFASLSECLVGSPYARRVGPGGVVEGVGQAGEGEVERFVRKVRGLVRPQEEDLQVGLNSQHWSYSPQVDTWIFPTLQLGMLGVREEENLVTRIIRLTALEHFYPQTAIIAARRKAKTPPPPSPPAPSPSPSSPPPPRPTPGQVTLSPSLPPTASPTTPPRSPFSSSLPSLPSLDIATGYMNLPLAYLNPLASSASPVRLLTASPLTNGWHDARGIARYVPSLYSALTLSTLHTLSSSPSLRILEWNRPGHSYHAKGLWLTGPGGGHPTLTIVGSTNFGARSLERDGEVSLVVVTQRGGLLAQELGKERDQLFEGGDEVTKDTFEAEGSPRRLPWLVRWVANFAKQYL